MLETLPATDELDLFDVMVSARLTEYAQVQGYLNQMPGLSVAVALGAQAVVNVYLTTNEMVDHMHLNLCTADVLFIDSTMLSLARVLMLSEPTERTTFLGGCSISEIEYPACMFPFFLNILRLMNINNDAN